MIRSMTGYGGAKGASGAITVSIELKSVNNRYLDCTVKIPRVYVAAEEFIKLAVQRHILRGKVDVFVTLDTSEADDITIKWNKPLAEAYLEALREMSDTFGIPGDVSTALLTRFPDVLRAEKRETDAKRLYADILAVLESALLEFDTMRTREGEKLSHDIGARLAEIERLTGLAEELSPVTVTEYRKKLETRMRDILGGVDIDEARILTEAALFADRTAINEETVRLKSHITQLRDMLQSQEPVGRKMDFLIQELNREANTIGSKGNNAEMSRIVVDLKAEIEKIREQAQNIE